MEKRFIEDSFPIREVSEESAKEKNIRKGHISSLHIWWARRPLVSSRATIYASLIPSVKNHKERSKVKKFLIGLSKRENILEDRYYLKARNDIKEAFKGRLPKILDPFSGGGSIPLEALKLGCETYACDYNPVAVLLNKCILEYPQKYGKKLIQDINKWGKWIVTEVKKEIIQFFPTENIKSKNYSSNSFVSFIPIGYIWVKYLQCQKPSCEVEIPLIKQFWLVKKNKKKISLFPYLEDKKVKFKLIGSERGEIPKNFDPNNGTVIRGKVRCLKCGEVIEPPDVKKIFQKNLVKEKLIAVVGLVNKKKNYRIATQKDIEAFEKCRNYLDYKIEQLEVEWNYIPIPNEPTPDGKGRGAERAFTIKNYKLDTWGDLFNSRQILVLLCFIEKLRQLQDKMLKKGYDIEYIGVIKTYFGLIIDRIADRNSSFCRVIPQSEAIGYTFSRQALSILWDYVEMNPFTHGGGWNKVLNQVVLILENLVKIKTSAAKVFQCSATELDFKDNFFDAVFTDPPYYDNIPYAHLSDYFYVWLKRSIGDIHPDLFSTPLSPKLNEIVAYTINRSWEESKNHFREMLEKSFTQIYRVLKPKGIAIIVYAHKTTEGWETIINALLNSGLVITASWPISTERKGRLRAKESTALASSIYIIARKIEKKEVCFYAELRKNMETYLGEKLEDLWNEGISGADFFIAAIGAGIEVFGKYQKIIDYNDNIIKADKLLEEIREITTNFAIKQILHNGFTEEISPLTRFYVLWRWNYSEAKVPFDEARKLAQSIGISLDQEWNKGFIRKEKQYIRVLGPKDRDLDKIKSSKELIDVLHHILLLWEKGESKKEELLEALSSYRKSDLFYRVAQAISQTLDNKSKEKQLIDGFLSIKEKLKENVAISSKKQENIEKFI